MSKLESSIIYDITPQRQLQYQYHKNGLNMQDDSWYGL